MWTGLHVIVLPKRMEAIFGPASAGLGLGLITLAGVVTAVLVQPTVGAISDYAVTRWGRRKPFIVIGSVLDIVFLWAVASADTYTRPGRRAGAAPVRVELRAGPVPGIRA